MSQKDPCKGIGGGLVLLLTEESLTGRGLGSLSTDLSEVRQILIPALVQRAEHLSSRDVFTDVIQLS